MVPKDHLAKAKSELGKALQLVQDEIRAYPTPISGCDAQFNYLIGLRGSIAAALHELEAPKFVATPRTPCQMREWKAVEGSYSG